MSWLAIKALPWRFIGVVALVTALAGWHIAKTHEAVTADRLERQAEALKASAEKETTNAETRKLLSSSIAKRNESVRVNVRVERDSLLDIIARHSDAPAIANCTNPATDPQRHAAAEQREQSTTYRHDPVVAALASGYAEQRAIALSCAAKANDVADALESIER
jgi:hypothetical protein